MNIYFGAPMFSDSEREYNAKVVNRLRKQFGDRVNIYSPSENETINDKSNYADSVMIAEADNMHLEHADLLIAVLDGSTIDAGLASEIGYFYSMNKPIIALYTDSRNGRTTNSKKLNVVHILGENQFAYMNLYTVGLIKKRGVIVQSIDSIEMRIHLLLNKGVN